MAKHDLGDIEAIRRSLELWLRRQSPGLSPLSLGEIVFPEASGESSVTLLLYAEVAAGPRNFVCRMLPSDSQVFEEHDLLLQYRLMELAGEAGVPVPSLIAYESDAEIVGSEFYVMEFVDGQIPPDRPPWASGTWVTDLTDDQRTRMWANGLQTLAAIHSIDLAASTIPGLPAAPQGGAVVQHEIDKFSQLLEGTSCGLHDTRLVEGLQYIRDNVPEDTTRCLCWGDARVGNIIWRDLSPVAVIDWEMANYGHPLQDVSWWYWIDYINCVGLGMERPGGLPELAQIYESWSTMTGHAVDKHRYFDLFSVLRYAIVLERKFDAFESAGMGRFENFSLPYVGELLEQALRY